MNRVLVTGSSGYIGQHLCKLLTDSGYEVWGLDKVYNENDKKWCYTQDITQPFMLLHFNTVIHLAALVRVNESVENPYDYYNTNINGTFNVLNGISCDNFIFASTGAAENPNSPYAYSKKCCEEIVADYCGKRNQSYTIFRFYNVIGTDGFPPTNPDGLFYNLVKAEQTGQLNVFGHDYNTPDGTPVRDYVHVMDICRAIKMAITKPANTIENLGTGIGHTVKEIAYAYQVANDVDFNINYLPRRNGDNERTVLDKPSSYMLNSYTLEELLKK